MSPSCPRWCHPGGWRLRVGKTMARLVPICTSIGCSAPNPLSRTRCDTVLYCICCLVLYGLLLAPLVLSCLAWPAIDLDCLVLSCCIFLPCLLLPCPICVATHICPSHRPTPPAITRCYLNSPPPSLSHLPSAQSFLFALPDLLEQLQSFVPFCTDAC